MAVTNPQEICGCNEVEASIPPVFFQINRKRSEENPKEILWEDRPGFWLEVCSMYEYYHVVSLFNKMKVKMSGPTCVLYTFLVNSCWVACNRSSKCNRQETLMMIVFVMCHRRE